MATRRLRARSDATVTAVTIMTAVTLQVRHEPQQCHVRFLFYCSSSNRDRKASFNDQSDSPQWNQRQRRILEPVRKDGDFHFFNSCSEMPWRLGPLAFLRSGPGAPRQHPTSPGQGGVLTQVGGRAASRLLRRRSSSLGAAAAAAVGGQACLDSQWQGQDMCC